MRALFVGGVVDNSELDLDGDRPPLSYPENGGAGQPRYRLSQIGLRDDAVVYAVYAAQELDDDAVAQVTNERDYPRRFEATPSAPR